MTIQGSWTRLYTGSEVDCFHASTISGNGSLVRLRTTTAADSRKLYRQVIASPTDESDFSAWTYLNLYNIYGCCTCSYGANVALFWVKSTGEIDCQTSSDYGATWSSVTYPGYAITTVTGGMAAAYKPNGDLALFFGDLSAVYVIERVSGSWQTRAIWDKTTGNIYGVATVYADGDWKLLVTGKDSGGDYKIWSLIYGDGGQQTANTWSDLTELQSSAAAGDYSFKSIFMNKPGTLNPYDIFFTKQTISTTTNTIYEVHAKLNDITSWGSQVEFADITSLYCVDVSSSLNANEDGYAWAFYSAGAWRATLESHSYGEVNSKFKLIATSYKNIISRFKEIVQTNKDISLRLKLIVPNKKDINSRANIIANSIKDAISKFKLQVQEDINVVSNFIVNINKDIQSRFKVLMLRDVNARFNNIVQEYLSIDSAFNVVSEYYKNINFRFVVDIHENINTRFKLWIDKNIKSKFVLFVNALKSIAAKFTVFVINIKNVNSKFKVLFEKDIYSKFKLWFEKNINNRFKVFMEKDIYINFVLQVFDFKSIYFLFNLFVLSKFILVARFRVFGMSIYNILFRNTLYVRDNMNIKCRYYRAPAVLLGHPYIYFVQNLGRIERIE